MDAIQAIMQRVSVREYSEREIPDAEVRKILEAGMSGPSCTNARDWSFIVVRDREMLNRMAEPTAGRMTAKKSSSTFSSVRGAERGQTHSNTCTSPE